MDANPDPERERRTRTAYQQARDEAADLERRRDDIGRVDVPLDDPRHLTEANVSRWQELDWQMWDARKRRDDAWRELLIVLGLGIDTRGAPF